MMKKIICLVLGLLMVLMAFTACGNEEDAKDAINDVASRTTTTLNMWVITESELVAEMSEGGWRTLVNGGSFGLEGGLAVTAVLAVACAVVLFVPTKKAGIAPVQERE